MSSYYHAIILNRKDHDEAVLERLQASVQRSLQAVHPAAVVRTAKEDYLARIEKMEGWDDWCRVVASGANPRYEIFFVPDMIIGRATYSILTGARQIGKHIIYTDEDGTGFRNVTGMQVITGGKSGKIGGSWIEYARLLLAPVDVS